VDSSEARHKASIRLIAGEMNGILEAAELVLIERGNYYQAGGLVVSIKVDPKTGDPTILPVWWSNLKRHNDRFFSNLNGNSSEQPKNPKNL
jgi:hypothetical protein